MNLKPYIGIWLILAVALAAIVGLSLLSPIEIFGVELQRSTFVDVLSTGPAATCNLPVEATTPITEEKPIAKEPIEPDTMPKSILFIGDSMLEGLSPRLAAYAKYNGHRLNSVIWYSSTTEVWGSCDKLAGFVKKHKPDFVVVCLGANELFVRDIITKRAKYVDNMLSQIGDIPYVWIGPPNWKSDTGINRLIASKTKPGSFFMSDGMHFDRAKDGAHPTRRSAELWMDSVVRWITLHSAHPIKLDKPAPGTARATSVTVLQPKK